jgi:hypothetical protein
MNDWLYNTEHSHRFNRQVHALMDLLLLSPLQLIILIWGTAQRRRARIHVLCPPPKLWLDVERCLIEVQVIWRRTIQKVCLLKHRVLFYLLSRERLCFTPFNHVVGGLFLLLLWYPLHLLL